MVVSNQMIVTLYTSVECQDQANSLIEELNEANITFREYNVTAEPGEEQICRVVSTAYTSSESFILSKIKPLYTFLSYI